MIYHGAPGFEDLPKYLKPQKTLFDFIAVQGVSGMVVGSPVSLRLRKPLVVVRKNLGDCHDDKTVVGVLKTRALRRWVFLDDFISSGNTLRRVMNALAEYPPAICVGAVEYMNFNLAKDSIIATCAEEYFPDRESVMVARAAARRERYDKLCKWQDAAGDKLTVDAPSGFDLVWTGR